MTDSAPLAAGGHGPGELLFDATLVPHRALSPRGFAALMLALAGVSFLAGMTFVLSGAWPVMGFLGLDVLLVWLAFHLNYRAARLGERVRLTRERLDVERALPGGRAARWTFQPYWVRLTHDEPENGPGRLTLSSHGRSVRFAAFLTPGERRALAAGLQAALAKIRAA